MRALLLCVACGLWLPWPAAAVSRPRRYLLISSPSTRRIYWAELPSFHDLTLPAAARPVVQAQVLIDGTARCSGWGCSENADAGLRKPTSLAVHQDSATLYVSDVEATDIYAYSLQQSWRDGGLQAGVQRKVHQGVAGGATGLAVDARGNLFFSSGQDGRVQMLPAKALGNLSAAAEAAYSKNSSAAVSAPAGLATDGVYIYWANSQGTGTSGAVARAPQRRAAAAQIPPRALTTAASAYEAKASSVCVARDNVFFTGSLRSLMAVKTTGGSITEVSRNFTKPVGCAYNGEGTLYVADAGAGAVYALPANLGSLRKVRHRTKVVSVDGPDQLAIFAGESGILLPTEPMQRSSARTVAGTGLLSTLVSVLALALVMAGSVCA